MKNINQKTLVIILLVLLGLALVYILFDKYTDFREEENFEYYQAGAQAGYEQAITQVMQQLATCQTVPLFVENVTINAIAVECLQQTNGL